MEHIGLEFQGIGGDTVGHDDLIHAQTPFHQLGKITPPVRVIQLLINNGANTLNYGHRHLDIQAFHVLEAAKDRPQANIRSLCNFLSRRRNPSFAHQFKHGGDDLALAGAAAEEATIGHCG